MIMNGERYHILQVIRPVAGGMRKYILDLLAHSTREIFRHTVFGPEDPALAAEVHTRGAEYLTADYRRPLMAAGQLRRSIQDLRPQLIHSHGYKACVLTQLATWGLGVPKVATLHNMLSPRDLWVFRFTQRVLPRYRQFIAVSPPLGQMLAPLGPVEVLLWGVESQPARSPGGQEMAKILVASRMLPGKGIETFLQALAQLEGSCPPPYVVDLAGSGPALETYQELGRQLKLDHRLRWWGYVEDMSRFWRTADLVVLPSHQEGLPLTLLEAMSWGVPIIATAVGGIPQALDYGNCGTLVPAQDVESLSQRIGEFLQDPRPFWALAAKARHRQQALFSLSRAVQAQEAIYRALLR